MRVFCAAGSRRAVCHDGYPCAVSHDWIIPDWPAPARVRALCSTRSGGVSVAPWDSCNLGDHVGDEPGAVRANRARFAHALQAAEGDVRPVFLRQVHGTQVLAIDHDTPDDAEADGCTSRTAGLACTVLVADCLPVLLTDKAGTRVAAAHAGWRGLAAGVLEATLQCFSPFGLESQAQKAIKTEVIAWLGPCIGKAAFEVGSEVFAAFTRADPGAATCFAASGNEGKYLADLTALARRRLAAAGVSRIYGNDGSERWCTVSNPARFFSHRRDASSLGASGRMAASIWLVG